MQPLIFNLSELGCLRYVSCIHIVGFFFMTQYKNLVSYSMFTYFTFIIKTNELDVSSVIIFDVISSIFSFL